MPQKVDRLADMQKPSPVVVSKPAPAYSPRQIGSFVSMGLGSAAIVTGVALYVTGYLDIQSLNDLHESDYEDRAAFEAAWDRRSKGRVADGKTRVYTSYAMFGVGAAALGTGLALYFTSKPGDGKKAQASILPGGPGDAGLTAMVTW